MALTATATPDVRQDIVRMLKLRSAKMFVTGFDRPNLTYAVQRCETELEKDAALLRFVKTQPGSGIIYCSTRKAVESVAEMLREKLHNRTIAAYHAGFNQDLRARAQREGTHCVGAGQSRQIQLRSPQHRHDAASFR